MDKFISCDIFDRQSEERAEANRVYTWAELDVNSTIYKVIKIDPQESKYPGKVNAILSCEDKSGERQIRIWAPSALLTELYENSPKTGYFRCHGVTHNEKNGRSKHVYSVAFQ